MSNSDYIMRILVSDSPLDEGGKMVGHAERWGARRRAGWTWLILLDGRAPVSLWGTKTECQKQAVQMLEGMGYDKTLISFISPVGRGDE